MVSGRVKLDLARAVRRPAPGPTLAHVSVRRDTPDMAERDSWHIFDAQRPPVHGDRDSTRQRRGGR